MRWLNHLRLKSKDADTRKTAIINLSPNCGVHEVRLFAQALHDENAAVRNAACHAISILRETSAAPCIAALMPLLKDKNYLVRREAASALDLLYWIPSTSEERVLKAIAQENFDNIAAIEDAAVGLLLPILKDDSSALRLAAAKTFERFQTRIQDPRIAQPLIDLLDDPEMPVRVAALHALSVSTDERRIPSLLKSLKNQMPQMRAGAVEALGKTGDAKYLSDILPLLKDFKFEVRIAAITALGRLKSPKVLDPIISMLTDNDTDVRKTAVDSLAELRDPRSVKVLIATLIDRESVVRHAAANALQIISFQWQISKEAQEAVPFLEASLKDDEYWVRESAAKALARIRNFQ